MDNLIHIESNARIKRKARICATFWTIIYAIMLVPLAYMTLFSVMVFDNPNISTLKGLSFIFMTALIPLSLPVSIDLMWSNYVCEKYDKTLLFWFVPWMVVIFVFIFEVIIK